MSPDTSNSGKTAAATVKVDLGARGYDIHVGRGLLAQAATLMSDVLKQKRVFIVTDSNVALLYLDPLTETFQAAGIDVGHVVVPAGEASKDFDHLSRILDAMLAAKCERSTMIVALGGGVVGDLAGFAASVLLRGVDFVQIPTTLLAQVDSSVGGKTGINMRAGKNLVGAFHQPRLVIADTDTLITLSKRERLAGYAEVVKYGLLGDASFFEWLEKNGQHAIGNEDTAHELLSYCITKSCEAKAKIVAADEKEGGVRALLNFGHTFGHALEAEMGYGDDLLHGEGVAIGMVMAFDLSVRLGLCPTGDAARVRAHFESVGLPVTAPKTGRGAGLTAEKLLAHMSQDKKVKDGDVTFVLVRGIGQAFLESGVPKDKIIQTLEQGLAA